MTRISLQVFEYQTKLLMRTQQNYSKEHRHGRPEAVARLGPNSVTRPRPLIGRGVCFAFSCSRVVRRGRRVNHQRHSRKVASHQGQGRQSCILRLGLAWLDVMQ